MLIFHGISTTLSHESAYTILEGLRRKMTDKLMKAPLGTVINQPIGQLKNQIIDRVETIERPIAHLIPEILPAMLLPMSIFIYIITIDWRMALASLLTIPIALIAYAFVLRTFNKKYEDYMNANNHVNSVIVEYVEGIQVIKAFNQSASSYEKFEQAVKMFLDYTLDWAHREILRFPQMLIARLGEDKCRTFAASMKEVAGCFNELMKNGGITRSKEGEEERIYEKRNTESDQCTRTAGTVSGIPGAVQK